MLILLKTSVMQAAKYLSFGGTHRIESITESLVLVATREVAG